MCTLHADKKKKTPNIDEHYRECDIKKCDVRLWPDLPMYMYMYMNVQSAYVVAN